MPLRHSGTRRGPLDSFWAGSVCCPQINLALAALKSLIIPAGIALQCSIRSATIATSDGVRSAQKGPEQTVDSINDT
jgi:hypothetical protein